MPLEPKWASSGGHMFYIGLYRESMKNLLAWNKAKSFDMLHHLVDLYQVCSDDAPGTKNGTAPGIMFYIGL